MFTTTKPTLRLTGSGKGLRLRVAATPDSLGVVGECSRAATAVDKALGEAVRSAVAAGHSWAEIGQALCGSSGQTAAVVFDDYTSARRSSWRMFWGLDGSR
jgi:hypothetical protein